RIRALISWGVYFLPSMSTVHDDPMWRLTDRMVRSGLVMAWRLATSPTRTPPDLEKPTTDGVVRPPSALGITVGSPASNTLTTELVVPRSIPTALAISAVPSACRSSAGSDRRLCAHLVATAFIAVHQCNKVESPLVKIFEEEVATPVFTTLNWWFPSFRRAHLRWGRARSGPDPPRAVH